MESIGQRNGLLPLATSVALLLFCASTVPRPAHCANILFYHGVSGNSHVSSVWPVIEELGARGHRMTLLTSVPPKKTHPAVSVVHVPEMHEILKPWNDGDLIEERLVGRKLIGDEVITLALGMCEAVFTSSATQKLLYNSSFDLVVMDTAINECALGLAKLHYKCAFMVYNALSVPPASQDDYGIPVESSWLPDMEDGQPVRTFADRLWGTWKFVVWALVKEFHYYPQLAQIFVKHLKLTETPDFVELQKSTSLVLQNSHYAHSYVMNLPPVFVSIAGIGMQEQRKELPKALTEFIATGKEGFIYISFGTQVLIHKSRPELRAKFFNAFGRFPALRFVWKWEGEKPAEAPSNIYFSKWMPQQDLLAHPAAKGYIGHGGMNGVNEGVNYGVPMIIFPIFGDQDFNGNALAAKALALVMELKDFSEQDLVDNINLVLHDEAFKSRVKRASQVFRDRPMKPVDTAVWWIEYVLRYEGDTPFLMPEGVHQTWWQRRLLDVWFFIYTVLLGSLVTLLFVGWKLGKWLWLLCASSNYDKNDNKLKKS